MATWIILRDGILQLGLLAPFVALACLAARRVPVKHLAAFLGLYLAHLLAMEHERLAAALFDVDVSLISGYWSWQAKIVATAIALGLALLWGRRLRATESLTLRQQPGSLNITLLFIAVPLVFTLAIFPLISFEQATRFRYDGETWAFQALLPGLHEEIVFRGIALAILNDAFGRSRTLLGTKFGWGLILTSVWFGIGHGASFAADGTLALNPFNMVWTGLFGLCWGFARERSGSVLLPILGHNAANLLGHALNWIVLQRGM